METVICCVFFWFSKAAPANSNYEKKTFKYSHLRKELELPKRLIFCRAYNRNEEHKYSRSEFYYPEDLMQRLTQASANVKTIL